MNEIESEWRFIKTNRESSCKLCETQIQENEQVLYSWKQKAVWCLACASKLGHTPGKGSNGNNDPRGQEREGKQSSTASGASLRWEIVTSDDGIIVLRRTDGEKR